MTGILAGLAAGALGFFLWISRREVRRLRAELHLAVTSRHRWEQLAIAQTQDLTAARKILDALADPGTIRADQVRISLEREGRPRAMQRKGFSSLLLDPRNDTKRLGGGDDGKAD